MSSASDRITQQWRSLKALGECPPASRPRLRARWIKAVEALLAVDASGFSEMLREVYPADGIAAVTERPNPLFSAMVTKALFMRPDSKGDL